MGQILNLLAIAFKNEHLSVSRLKLFEQCMLAFYYRYIDKGDVEPRGVASLFGVVLHAALELTYTWVLENEWSGLFPTERLTDFYRQAWQASDLATGGAALYAEGLQILRAYGANEATIDHWSILSSEQEFNIDVGGYVVNGYIDLVVKVADDHVRIIDYKSNRLLFTQSELETDLQMSVYGLAARKLYPWARTVSFAFKMLRHNVTQSADRTLQTIDDAAEYVVQLGRKSEEPRRPEDWPATLNSNCSYCDHRRRCPLYQKLMAGDHEVTKLAPHAGLAEMAAQREHLAMLAKVYYARKKELDDLLKKKLEVEGEFDASGYHYRMISGGVSITYEPGPVLKTFTEAGLTPSQVAAKVLRVDKEAVEKLLADVMGTLPKSKAMVLKATVEALAKSVPNAQKIDSRQIKQAKKVHADDVAKEAAQVAKDEAKRNKKAGQVAS